MVWCEVGLDALSLLYGLQAAAGFNSLQGQRRCFLHILFLEPSNSGWLIFFVYSQSLAIMKGGLGVNDSDSDSLEELKRRHGMTVEEFFKELQKAVEQAYRAIQAFLNKHRDAFCLVLRMLTVEARQMEEQEKHKRHIQPLRTKGAPYRQPMRHQVVNRKPVRQIARSRC